MTIESCSKCGVLFDSDIVKSEKVDREFYTDTEYKISIYQCPCCKEWVRHRLPS